MVITLNKEQQEIVYSNAKNIVVIAAAASGKTATLTERARFLLQQGIDPTKIVLMTFTNTAAEEMSQRIGNHNGMYIGTIHGYANQLLLRYGIDTQDEIASENFDDLFEKALNNPNCAKKVDYLLIDEAQDLTELEYQFIFDIIKPASFFAVGDHRQSIYGFRGSRPDLFLSLCDRDDTIVYHLNKNYRNDSSILNFAKRIINKVGYKYIDDSFSMSGFDGNVYERQYSPTAIVNMIKSSKMVETADYKDWFILARYNSHVDEMFRALTEANIPCETFKRSDMDNNEIAITLNNNTVKVLTIHAAKGLEAKNVAVIGAKFFSDEEKRIAYVAATRAKRKLFWYTATKAKTKKMLNWE